MDLSRHEHPLTGQPVVPAPHRASRPRGSAASGCMFCPGQEARTPPTLAQEPASGPWSARAFANLYPILELHEVIVDTPRHAARFDELTAHEARGAVRLWARRLADAAARQPFVMLYRNDGAAAGASIPHSHAQLVGTGRPLPNVAAEADRLAKACPFEQPGAWRDRHEEDGVVHGRPRVGRFGGERWIAPVDHVGRLDQSSSQTLDVFAQRLWHVCQAVVEEGVGGYNVLLHTAPRGQDRYHWHAEVLPRRDGIAGLELGAGLWVDGGGPS